MPLAIDLFCGLGASGRVDDDRNVTEVHASRSGENDKAVLFVCAGLEVTVGKARAA